MTVGRSIGRLAARWSCLAALAVTCVVLAGGTGCRRPSTGAEDVRISMEVTPSPPVVGIVAVDLRIADLDGAPLEATSVKLEGNMSHAGMTPSFADAIRTGPGTYRADLDLTMGGDWFVLVDAVLADGRTVQQKIDLPGVRLK